MLVSGKYAGGEALLHRKKCLFQTAVEVVKRGKLKSNASA
jgi:hypothetical protein